MGFVGEIDNMDWFDIEKQLVKSLVNEYGMEIDHAWSSVLDYFQYEVFRYIREVDIPTVIEWCLAWPSNLNRVGE